MFDFLRYQTFPSEQAARPFLELLRQHEVPFETSVDSGQPDFDPTMAFNRTYATFVVSLHGPDFEWVRRLEEDAHREALATLSPDHYLFGFTDVELFNILTNPLEWSSLDVILAGQLLRQRGRDVSADTIRLLREHRLAADAQPERSSKGRIIWGYLLALLGGVIGIFIGWELHASKRTLSDGRQVPAYPAAERAHGLRIMVLGIVSFLCWFAVRVWVVPSR